MDDPTPTPPPTPGDRPPWPGYEPLPGHPQWGYAVDPAHTQWQQPVHPPTTTERTTQRGILGGIAAAILAFLKYGLALLKFGKFGATFLSMAVSLWFYALFFGWKFAVGIVALIFAHEMGHFGASVMLGVPVSGPRFIPFLGAFTMHAGLEDDRRKEAIIAIAGPITGFLAGLGLYLLAQSADVVTDGVALMLVLAQWACMITLFNLIPLNPLDGGRVAGAVSRWAYVAGLAIFAGIIILEIASDIPLNPLLILFLLFGGYTSWQRFQRARRGQDPPPLDPVTRNWIIAAYIALVAASGLGISLTHNALALAGFTH
jgi:Zn-dependent protease